jgi:hypothetical protein
METRPLPCEASMLAMSIALLDEAVIVCILFVSLAQTKDQGVRRKKKKTKQQTRVFFVSLGAG